MKCAHPMCNRGIGLVSHRRGWFDTRLYCSKACRRNYAAGARNSPLSPASDTSLFALLFALPGPHRDPVPVPARRRAR